MPHIGFKVKICRGLAASMTSAPEACFLKKRFDIFAEAHITVGENDIGRVILCRLVFTGKQEERVKK